MSALSNLTVIDMSRILAGPFAAQTLADMGAKVIKIEHPSGDDTRRWGPPFVTRADGNQDAAYYFCANRNKTNLVLDFTQDTEREQLLSMVATADVLIENYKVGGLKKYGLDYDSLKQINPKLIYCSITGFGQTGPYKDRPGYDALIQAMGGLMSITGEADGSPQKVGVAVVDLMTALYTTTAILAAVNHRHLTGEGQYIDIALFDVQAAMLANQGASYLLGGHTPMRQGSAHPSIAPYQPMRVKDGFIMLAIGNDTQFEQFCKAAKCPGLARDTRFLTNTDRVAKRSYLEQSLAPFMIAKTIDEWVSMGEEYGFPCGPINTIDRVFQDPQLRDRNMVVTTDEGFDLVANPIKFSATPILNYQTPPSLPPSQHGAQPTPAILSTPDDVSPQPESGAPAVATRVATSHTTPQSAPPRSIQAPQRPYQTHARSSQSAVPIVKIQTPRPALRTTRPVNSSFTPKPIAPPTVVAKTTTQHTQDAAQTTRQAESAPPSKFMGQQPTPVATPTNSQTALSTPAEPLHPQRAPSNQQTTPKTETPAYVLDTSTDFNAPIKLNLIQDFNRSDTTKPTQVDWLDES